MNQTLTSPQTLSETIKTLAQLIRKKDNLPDNLPLPTPDDFLRLDFTFAWAFTDNDRAIVRELRAQKSERLIDWFNLTEFHQPQECSDTLYQDIKELYQLIDQEENPSPKDKRRLARKIERFCRRMDTKPPTEIQKYKLADENYMQAFRDIVNFDDHDALDDMDIAWRLAKETNPDLKHPFTSRIRTWYKYQHRVTEEDDRRKPSATLHQNSAGALRTHWHTNDRNDTEELPQLEQPPESAQFYFEGSKPSNTIIPAGGLTFSVTPRVTPVHRKGQVPVPFSAVEEGLFLLPPKITSGEFSIELGELTARIFKYNNRVYEKNRELVIASLGQLYNDIWIPYEDPSGGGSGTWRPLVPLNPPAPGAKDNYLVHLYMSTPYGHIGGYVIEKNISRQLRFSLIQSNLYRTACAFFDKLGNIDSTIPIEPPRNTDPNPKKQYYIREDGTPYLDQRGKPITDLYHPDLIPHLKRDDNPNAKYRDHLWDTETIIRAGQIDYNSRRKSQNLGRTLAQLHRLTQMKDENGNTNPPFHVKMVTRHGEVSPIAAYPEKNGKVTPPPHFVGIYLIPTKRHINLKRAVNQSSRHSGR